MPKKRDVIGIRELMQKTYDNIPFSHEWARFIGFPPRNFSMLVYGPSGEGKSTLIMRLVKELCRIYMDSSTATVLYWSCEEGVEKSIQDLAIREGLEAYAGKVMFYRNDEPQKSFEKLVERMGTKNTERFVIIDSIDFMGLTEKQWKYLRSEFPDKALICISWIMGSQPLSSAGKAIKYASSIKVRVSQFMAYPTSRHGGNVPLNIWPEYEQNMHGLLGQKDKNYRSKLLAPAAPSGAVFVIQGKTETIDSRTLSILDHIAQFNLPVKRADIPRMAQKCWPVGVKEMSAEHYVEWVAQLDVLDATETVQAAIGEEAAHV